MNRFEKIGPGKTRDLKTGAIHIDSKDMDGSWDDMEDYARDVREQRQAEAERIQSMELPPQHLRDKAFREQCRIALEHENRVAAEGRLSWLKGRLTHLDGVQHYWEEVLGTGMPDNYRLEEKRAELRKELDELKNHS